MQVRPIVKIVQKAIFAGTKAPKAVEPAKVFAAPLKVVRPTAQKASVNLPKLTTAQQKAINLANADKSLEPEFLKSLLNIEGKTSLETANLIKDELLKKMGYKHPELLKIKELLLSAVNGFVYAEGVVYLQSFNVRNKKFIISMIRHELDHVDKYLKIYKTQGKNKFIDAIISSSNGKLSKKDFIKQFNQEFYDVMSADTSTLGFDSEKFYKAACNYKNLVTTSVESKYKYFDNPHEIEAYRVQRKVQEILGDDTHLAIDGFPKNYKVLLALAHQRGIHSEKLILEKISELSDFALFKHEKPENIKKIIDLAKKINIPGGKLTAEERNFFNEMYSHIKFDRTTYQNIYSDIEYYFRYGKFSP